MQLLDGLRVIDDSAVRRRILHQRAEHLGADLEIRVARHPHLDAAHTGPGLHHIDRLRMAFRCDQEDFLPRLALERVAHRHRFGRRRRLVEQRCVRDLDAGQVDHHRLEREQRFEPALRDLRLIRRVGRVPAGILDDIPLNHRRRDAVGVTHSDERAEDLILGRQRAEVRQHFRLRHPLGQIESAAEANFGRNRRVYQRIERLEAECLEHLGDVTLVGSYVSGNE